MDIPAAYNYEYDENRTHFLVFYVGANEGVEFMYENYESEMHDLDDWIFSGEEYQPSER